MIRPMSRQNAASSPGGHGHTSQVVAKIEMGGRPPTPADLARAVPSEHAGGSAGSVQASEAVNASISSSDGGRPSKTHAAPRVHVDGSILHMEELGTSAFNRSTCTSSIVKPSSRDDASTRRRSLLIVQRSRRSVQGRRSFARQGPEWRTGSSTSDAVASRQCR